MGPDVPEQPDLPDHTTASGVALELPIRRVGLLALLLESAVGEEAHTNADASSPKRCSLLPGLLYTRLGLPHCCSHSWLYAFRFLFCYL